MSKFETLVRKMRAAQIAYNQNPSGDNLCAVEELEDEVDGYLDFCGDKSISTMQDVKKYLRARA